MNPCGCGYAGDSVRACRCTPPQIDRYASRLSGPLRDRIDLTVTMNAMPDFSAVVNCGSDRKMLPGRRPKGGHGPR